MTYLLTDKVLSTRRTVEELPSDRVFKLVIRWRQMTPTQQYENRLEFLDRNEKHFDWDNGELIETKDLVENDLGPHPGVPHEVNV